MDCLMDHSAAAVDFSIEFLVAYWRFQLDGLGQACTIAQLHGFLKQWDKAELQIGSRDCTNRIKLTVELLLQFIDFFLIALQFLGQLISLKEVAFVSEKYLGDSFITV